VLVPLLLALPGCGGDTPTVASPPPPISGPDEPPATGQTVDQSEASGPYGDLGITSVGPVEVGMDEKQAEAIFGKPDKKEEVSFAGPGVKAPQIDWVWELSGGQFRLKFETKNHTVTGYSTQSSDLTTEEGFGVGTDCKEIRDKYGDQLGEAPLGSGTLMLSEGAKDTYPGLVFACDDKTDQVTEVGGGEAQPAGD